jgi:hypothetical protein
MPVQLVKQIASSFRPAVARLRDVTVIEDLHASALGWCEHGARFPLWSETIVLPTFRARPPVGRALHARTAKRPGRLGKRSGPRCPEARLVELNWSAFVVGTMPSKRSDMGASAEPVPTYAEWRARAAALLERQGIFSGVMRERQWRRLFMTGATPEDAAERAQVHYNNTRPPFERMRKR